jgi:putative peptide zinc metalloprotease protein
VDRSKAQAELKMQQSSARSYRNSAHEANLNGDTVSADQFNLDAKKAEDEARNAGDQLKLIDTRLAKVKELRAPRAGIVLAAPQPEEIGKLFDRGYTETSPLFSVGDPNKLMVRVPVNPPDYRLLKEDLAASKSLDVSVLIKGRSDREFTARLKTLPAQNAETVPVQLTQRGGGPLAIKPGGDPNILVPLAQVYIVDLDVTDPDGSVLLGQISVVKIHTQWRSGAWWVGRALANALDIGLY